MHRKSPLYQTYLTKLQIGKKCAAALLIPINKAAASNVEKQSNEINSIDTLFDLLNFKEKSALTQLTTGLLNLYMNANDKIN